jgi:hypothetical protein
MVPENIDQIVCKDNAQDHQQQQQNKKQNPPRDEQSPGSFTSNFLILHIHPRVPWVLNKRFRNGDWLGNRFNRTIQPVNRPYF